MLHYKTFLHDTSTEWVTFVHGAGGNSATWYKQVKAYRQNFNVLLVDLRGHGKSQSIKWSKNDSFKDIATDIKLVLDAEQIGKTHMVGISLGTIIIQTFSQLYPQRLASMILGGAVVRLNMRTKFLISVGNMTKHVIPYMWLYKLFAWIIMPKSNHLESRLAFVTQAKKMYQKEFIRWFKLTRAIDPFLARLQRNFNGIPTLFVMGDEDYLFLPPVEEVIRTGEGLSLEIVPDSGHVCNIDQADYFNTTTINYIKNLAAKQR
ncbi:alpha/beta fold hydrolase [Salisediminibacterium selenitireducens]|uniref:Alpha/beta hydrolase fold protein n=1 Tax=Bacillus selenitireducens (strain ATCC 700615 / DSM 15326 / MLS10) TaxID=439292 RepID=D6XXM6_BACIE|nr:alpha/beta hydrolase [Salisediminibacterium selenitireducens]ADI00069.1 alpha/beta hydrolase fold protein [[Bacillus] selenitireducens MLS10]